MSAGLAIPQPAATPVSAASSSVAALATPLSGAPAPSKLFSATPEPPLPVAAAAAAAAATRPKRLPSVLTSDVHNEAEIIFQILEHKEKKCISYLDCITLMRGMGMNPTTEDMEELHESMKEPIARLEEFRLEEERRKEKERKKEEAKNPKKDIKKDAKDAKKPDPKKSADGGEAKEGEEGGEAGAPKKKVLTEPPEEIKNIDWSIFITCVEPVFKDSRTEEEEIVAALRIFDPTGKGTITRTELIKIVTQNGESVLSPAEVKQLMDAFPDEIIQFREFAQRLQGTYKPPEGPSKEEIEAQKEKERKEAEERARKEADPLSLDNLISKD